MQLRVEYYKLKKMILPNTFQAPVRQTNRVKADNFDVHLVIVYHIYCIQ